MNLNSGVHSTSINNNVFTVFLFVFFSFSDTIKEFCDIKDLQLYKDLGVNSKGVSSENVMLIGNVLVAGCDDGLIRLWDIKTGIYIYIYIPSPLGMRVSNTRQCMTQEILTLKKIKIIYIFFSLRKAYLEIILL